MLERAIQVAAGTVELIYEITDRPFQLPSVMEGETLVTDGPDDLWPHGEYERCQVTDNTNLHVAEQWGLKLPNGQIHWKAWQGISFGDPMGRVRMIAALQKTAEDIGFPAGFETEDFLSKYQWVTRLEKATVEYEDTGAYPLTDPYVSALGTPEVDESCHGDNPENPLHAATSVNGQNPDVDLCPRPVGGDA